MKYYGKKEIWESRSWRGLEAEKSKLPKRVQIQYRTRAFSSDWWRTFVCGWWFGGGRPRKSRARRREWLPADRTKGCASISQPCKCVNGQQWMEGIWKRKQTEFVKEKCVLTKAFNDGLALLRRGERRVVGNFAHTKAGVSTSSLVLFNFIDMIFFTS